MTLNEYIDSLKSKRVAVLGIGISNMPLIDLLTEHEIMHTVCDRRTALDLGDSLERVTSPYTSLRLGEGYLDDLDFDIIFRTPAILPTQDKLREAVGRGVAISSEMELFFRFCPCTTIAVTGSDGKTTTASIIAELLRVGGKTVHLGGNIGRPLLRSVDSMSADDVAVVELSSFQLHSVNIKPDTAVITNLSPNHLDIHIDYDDYIEAKKGIFKHQDEACRLVLNADNAESMRTAKDAKSKIRLFSANEAVRDGVFCRDDMIYLARNYEVEAVLPAAEILIPGKHNVENYMAAFAAVEGIISAESCRSVARAYKGVEHRLEVVGEKNSVTYINDSIASSPTRTIAGLRAMRKKPILIAGGHDKNIPFDKLADEICERVKSLILTGDTAMKIKEAVRASVFYEPTLQIKVCADFCEAVEYAREIAADGDIVLLSPACSSFDRFKNFTERGELFKKTVREF